MTALRYYQRESINAMLAYWQSGGLNPLIELATGTGKSVVLAKITQQLLTDYPTLRMLILVHQRELVSQNFKAMIRAWPQAPVGINSAGLGRRDFNQPIVFASIQSVFRSARKLGPRDIVLVDECDLIPEEAGSMYRQLFNEIEAPDGLRVGGMTATPFRLNSGRIDSGKDRLFHKTVYTYDIAKGIDDGFLAPLTSKATVQRLDVSGVGKRGGEFIPGQLEVVVDRDWITRAAVGEIIEFGRNRNSWLVFCSGIKHAEHVAEEMKLRGIVCEAVSSETSAGDRARILAAFQAGQIKCVTNANLLTTGFDNPNIDLVAMLRPTLSARLYLQIIGRGTRPVYPAGFDPNAASVEERKAAISVGPKPDCLVLDFAQNVMRFGPVDAIQIQDGKPKGDAESKPLAKECPVCSTLVALAARTCPTCGHLWPERLEPKHDAVADATTSIISKGAAVWVDVDRVTYFKHTPASGNPPSLRAEYWCGFTVHKEYVCFAHSGFARQKAEQWWRRCAQGSIPRDADEALARFKEINAPSQIQVQPDGKYFRVTGRRFAQIKEEAAA